MQTSEQDMKLENLMYVREKYKEAKEKYNSELQKDHPDLIFENKIVEQNDFTYPVACVNYFKAATEFIKNFPTHLSLIDFEEELKNIPSWASLLFVKHLDLYNKVRFQEFKTKWEETLASNDSEKIEKVMNTIIRLYVFYKNKAEKNTLKDNNTSQKYADEYFKLLKKYSPALKILS